MPLDDLNRAGQPGSCGPLGQVLSVRGSEAKVGLRDGGHERRATVGKFLAIGAGSRTLIGMIREVSAGGADGAFRAVAGIDLMGEIEREAGGQAVFRRGVADYPAIGDPAALVSSEELGVIYAGAGRRRVPVGTLNQDSAIPACIDPDSLLSKHFAVLGSTGVGKSSAVAVILREVVAARPDLRVFMLDGHNEYARSFGDKAHVIAPGELRLPFWLFNFEEFTDVLYGGRPGVPEELEILAELIPLAKAAYQQQRSQADRLTLKRAEPKGGSFTVDTPVPYLIQDLVNLVDERMGKLENRASRMNYHRLMTRIEPLRNDPRYAFMFENANVGGDTMANLLCQLFRLEKSAQPISILQLAGLPAEVIDAVVSLVCRLAFDFGLWSDGAVPLLFVCEEAHRYAAADGTIGFAPTRRALSRIAKEGRKYGVYLGLVTQRPAELDPTIISQCSTLFAMRMANEHDQALLRSAVSDAAVNLLDFVPSLGTGEVVGFGEGVPLPARFRFSTLPAACVPRSESSARAAERSLDPLDRAFVKAVVDRWRGAQSGQKPREEADGVPEIGAALPHGVPRQPQANVGSLLEQARLQVLKR